MHNFESVSERNKKEIENLYKLLNKLPAFKMRKTQLKSPFDKSEIITDYSLVEFSLNKGEPCVIQDNANQIKWKVFSLEKNRHFYVPSVCFVVKGPDSELIEMVNR